MKIKLAVAILALASASAAVAQSQPIRVKVTPEPSEASQHIADRSGQLGSSSRYALVTESSSEDILLGVDCLSNMTLSGQQIGVACDMTITYWPVPGVGLNTDLTGALAVGSELEAAQNLFDSFVEETSDEKLNQAVATFKKYLNAAIALYPKGVASLHQPSKFTDTRAKLVATTKNRRKGI